MSRDSDKYRVFTRRAILIGLGQTALFSLLGGRLYYLQILQSEKYRTMAEENRISLRLIAPPRGQVFDRFGTALAINQQNYRVVFVPQQIDEINEAIESLSKYISFSDGERKRIEKDYEDAGSTETILARDNLTWEQVSAISLNMPDLVGTEIEMGEVRSYPFSEVMAHILGYVGAVSTKDLNKNDPELKIPGFRVGKIGIEKQYDNKLRGAAGNVQLEVNAHGRIVRELSREEPTPGQDVTLTLDMGLQQFVKKRISEEESVAAVVMDIHNGSIYALASHPSYDPNLFTYGISQEDWNTLNTDEHTPLLNKAVDGVYSPGSTFKIITALSALEADLTDPEDTVFCPGHMDLGNHRFHCWKRGGHGTVNLKSALAGSCDVYFYEMGRRTGIDKIHAMAKRFGLGQKSGIDLPHERAGRIPNRAWKLSTYGSPWQQGETLIAAIGQGDVLATPLQLAVVAARVANGGFAIKPRLVAKVGNKELPLPDFAPMGLKPQNLQTLREAMAAVVMQPIGTAYSARVKEPGYELAGKTGTAQVRRISLTERAGGVIKNENLPWKFRDHALFTGFAPAANPQYAVAVVVEHGGSGAHVAVPIARDIIVECQKRNLAAKLP